MNIQESMEYIAKLNERGSVLGLENIKRLLERLDNPQNRVPVIHVAGTNGKGSTIAFMEGILREAGYKVGKYISPTIYTYLERFQVNGIYMSELDFAHYATLIKKEVDVLEAQGLYPTAFEVETAIAFLYCKDNSDIMLLETGMGGRLDSTNVVDRPLCTVLASISKDHMQFLGDTLEEIAMEKAGILRTGVLCVSNAANVRVEDTLKSVCESICAEYRMGLAHIISQDKEKTKFSFDGENYEIHLLGNYQVDNAVTAIMASQEAMKRLDGELSVSTIQAGLKKTKWSGRMEQVGEYPDFYVDGAHNVDACSRLKTTVGTYFGDCEKIFIIGILKDKEYEAMMQIIAPEACVIYTVTPQNARGLDGNLLAQVCRKYCNHVNAMESLDEAVKVAKELALSTDKKSVVIAFGSLSYIGSIKNEAF